MLLYYSFVQSVIQLFDDVSDDAEYHLHNICAHYIYPALDVNVRQQMSTRISTLRRMVTGGDGRRYTRGCA